MLGLDQGIVGFGKDLTAWNIKELFYFHVIMKSDMEVHISFKSIHQEEWDLSLFASAQPSSQ